VACSDKQIHAQVRKFLCHSCYRQTKRQSGSEIIESLHQISKFHKTNMNMAQGSKLLYTMWHPKCDTYLEQDLFYVCTSIITSQYVNIRIKNHKFIYPRQTALPRAPSSILALKINIQFIKKREKGRNFHSMHLSLNIFNSAKDGQ
jgi:hypothetical protein